LHHRAPSHQLEVPAKFTRCPRSIPQQIENLSSSIICHCLENSALTISP
jgi:hypothetical protein